MTDKQKVKSNKDCKDAHHTFVVTSWYERGGHRKANIMRCCHCLMPMNIEEIESQEWAEQNGINNV